MTERPAPLIPCDQAVRQLWEYVEGAVTPVDHARIEEHLAICRRCCGELEFVKHLRGLLAEQATDEVPPDVIRRLEGFVEELEP
jgi:anti-sigma factor (TIGR02949 family)